jgi:hypothetical protein
MLASAAVTALPVDWSMGTVKTGAVAIDLCPNACLMTARFTLASTGVTSRECFKQCGCAYLSAILLTRLRSLIKRCQAAKET